MSSLTLHFLSKLFHPNSAQFAECAPQPSLPPFRRSKAINISHHQRAAAASQTAFYVATMVNPKSNPAAGQLEPEFSWCVASSPNRQANNWQPRAQSSELRAERSERPQFSQRPHFEGGGKVRDSYQCTFLCTTNSHSAQTWPPPSNQFISPSPFPSPCA